MYLRLKPQVGADGDHHVHVARSSGEKTQSLIMNIGDISDITLQLESSELNGEKLLGGKFELQTVRG